MWRQLRPAIVILLIMTIITGVVYPLVVTGIAQGLFYHKANGSMIQRDNKVIGSELIGQQFDDPKYFWGRLSVTTPPYNGGSSSGSNYGPSSKELQAAVKARLDALHTADPANNAPVPVDLVTSSASGLDPDISVAAALYQVPRVARLRRLDEARVHRLVMAQVQGRQLGVFGENRINVLKLNLALDGVQ